MVYIGYVVPALALLAAVKVRQEETRLWVLCAIIFFVLVVGPFLHINGKDLFSVRDTPFYIP
jgi:4-amino-4-deoxy-L-arabinose transferase-like glycosyltransferase